MRLYHGSTCVIEHPDVTRSRPNLDFGQGFYLTSYREQAERWALRKSQFANETPVVNVYDISDDFSSLNVLSFPENDANWVDFVCRCRRGARDYLDYDLIIGGVADDKVYEAVSMYFRGYWDMETTLQALSYYERNDQYCFVSQKATDAALTYLESYEVPRERH